MRTKSPGSTKGMGYITPSKPVGRLMLNFMSASHRRQGRGDRGRVVGAADHHLVEADGAVFLEPGPDLGRRAAGGVPAHDVVADEAINLGPVLRGVSRAQRRLVELRP